MAGFVGTKRTITFSIVLLLGFLCLLHIWSRTHSIEFVEANSYFIQSAVEGVARLERQMKVLENAHDEDGRENAKRLNSISEALSKLADQRDEPPPAGAVASASAGGFRPSSSKEDPFADLTCPPPLDDSGFEKISDAAEAAGANVKKYANHADADKEACRKGTWNLVNNKAHEGWTRSIMKELAVQRGDSVYDWGSGCGDTLGWMHEWQGVNGFGVELVEAAVVRAKAKFTGPRYCTGNAADMAGIPAERFNHAVAIGTIYQ